MVFVLFYVSYIEAEDIPLIAGLRLLLEPNYNVKVKGALSTSCLQLLSPLRSLEAFDFQFYHFTQSCLISY